MRSKREGKCFSCIHFSEEEKPEGFIRFFCDLYTGAFIGQENYLIGRRLRCRCWGDEYKPETTDGKHKEG